VSLPAGYATTITQNSPTSLSVQLGIAKRSAIDPVTGQPIPRLGAARASGL
jgi:hypothetical protein